METNVINSAQKTELKDVKQQEANGKVSSAHGMHGASGQTRKAGVT
jgi:hypothetical protein